MPLCGRVYFNSVQGTLGALGRLTSLPVVSFSLPADLLLPRSHGNTWLSGYITVALAACLCMCMYNVSVTPPAWEIKQSFQGPVILQALVSALLIAISLVCVCVFGLESCLRGRWTNDDTEIRLLSNMVCVPVAVETQRLMKW